MKYWKPSFPPFEKYKKNTYQQIIKTGEFVYQIGELDELRQKSKPVSIKKINTKEFKAKVRYVKKCLLKYRKITGKGRGITAVQVGIPEAFSVIYMPEILKPFGFAHGEHVQHDKENKDDLLVIINPKITKSSDKLLKYPEMCMSAAPIISPNVRPAWVEFEYLDEKGIKRKWTVKDADEKLRMYNRVFQHEIDHINGIINIDLVKSRELMFESDPQFYEKASFQEGKATIKKAQA